jgi:hypothetical protein
MTLKGSMETPRRPADAYFVMEKVLGDKWFLQKPPLVGVRLVVVGRDRVPTQWDITPEIAPHVRAAIRSEGSCSFNSTTYDDRGKL